MDKQFRLGSKKKCKKSFHVSGLPGGFTEGYSYKIVKVTGEEVFFIDDEDNTDDPMSMFLDENMEMSVYEYFEI